MFNNKRRYEKDEAETILGMAISIKERKEKGKSVSEEDIKMAKKSGLKHDNIIRNAKKFKTEEQKKKDKAETEEKQKENNKNNEHSSNTNTRIRKIKKSKMKQINKMYLSYFIIWGVVILVLFTPFLLEKYASVHIKYLWAFVMGGLAIVGLIGGIFVDELEGALYGFGGGAVLGIGMFFLLKTSWGMITGLVILLLISVFLFFFMFKERIKRRAKSRY